MGSTPDRAPGPLIEEGIYFDSTTTASTPGEMRYTGTRFSLCDESGEFDPSAGTGISEAQHRTLRHLIHFIDDGPAEGFTTGCYKETLPSASPFPTSEIWYESSAKLKKIVELLTTWTGILPTTEVWKIYDTDGSTVLWTITDTIAYSGVFEDTRTRAIASGP